MTGEALFIEVSPGEGNRYPAPVGAIIGRQGCEVVIGDPEISRRHAAIRSVEGGIGVEDLGSRNGTLVNGERIDMVCLLRPGDRLQLGNTVLRFESSGELAAAGAGAGRGESRGDVPAPEAVPSVIRRAPPLEAIGPPTFAAPGRRIRGSAARRVGATVVCYAVVLVTAVLVVLYFATR